MFSGLPKYPSPPSSPRPGEATSKHSASSSDECSSSRTRKSSRSASVEDMALEPQSKRLKAGGGEAASTVAPPTPMEVDSLPASQAAPRSGPPIYFWGARNDPGLPEGAENMQIVKYEPPPSELFTLSFLYKEKHDPCEPKSVYFPDKFPVENINCKVEVDDPLHLYDPKGTRRVECRHLAFEYLNYKGPKRDFLLKVCADKASIYQHFSGNMRVIEKSLYLLGPNSENSLILPVNQLGEYLSLISHKLANQREKPAQQPEKKHADIFIYIPQLHTTSMRLTFKPKGSKPERWAVTNYDPVLTTTHARATVMSPGDWVYDASDLFQLREQYIEAKEDPDLHVTAYCTDILLNSQEKSQIFSAHRSQNPHVLSAAIERGLSAVYESILNHIASTPASTTEKMCIVGSGRGQTGLKLPGESCLRLALTSLFNISPFIRFLDQIKPNKSQLLSILTETSQLPTEVAIVGDANLFSRPIVIENFSHLIHHSQLAHYFNEADRFKLCAGRNSEDRPALAEAFLFANPKCIRADTQLFLDAKLPEAMRFELAMGMKPLVLEEAGGKTVSVPAVIDALTDVEFDSPPHQDEYRLSVPGRIQALRYDGDEEMDKKSYVETIHAWGDMVKDLHINAKSVIASLETYLLPLIPADYSQAETVQALNKVMTDLRA
jgi:hypothetical protein